MKGKPLKNNANQENELRQKKALQASCLSGYPWKKKRQTKPLRKNDDASTKELKGQKKNEQKKKLRQLGPLYSKLLEDGLTQDGVKNIYSVYLEHHPIRKGIQSDFNTMGHNLTTSFNHHPKQIW